MEFHHLFGWAVVLEEKIQISKIFLNPIISVPRPAPYPKESSSSRLSSEIAYQTTVNVFLDVHGMTYEGPPPYPDQCIINYVP